MLREYYYDKYAIDYRWDRNPSNAIASEEFYSNDYDSYGSENTPFGTYDDKLLELADKTSCYFLSNGEYACIPVDVYTYFVDAGDPDPLNPQDFGLINEGTADFPDYRYQLTDEQRNFFKSGKLVYENDKAIGIIIYGWTDAVVASTSVKTKEELIEYRKLKPYTAYKHNYRGSLIEEDVIKNETFPKDGVKNGFWWVRGEEYTIPAPTLLSPENAILVNEQEGDSFPELIFKLNKRHEDESLKYHARVQIGLESDFVNPIQTKFSKDNQTNWYYKDSNENWVDFPADGVPGGTEVKYVPTIAELQFGFYYWGATAWHSFWNFGIKANPRMVIVVTDTDDLYYLVINGKPYRALALDLQESSNGEIGNINIQLLNKS